MRRSSNVYKIIAFSSAVFLGMVPLFIFIGAKKLLNRGGKL